MPQIVLATANPGKIAEIRQIMAGLPVDFLTREQLPVWPHIVEHGTTYLENALIKARALVELSGKPALADDSGIEIDALRGAPGVRSARFAGPRATDIQNNLRMAYLLRNVPVEQRGARYRCWAVLVTPGGAHVEAEGTCEGRIAPVPRGSGGFGYDPWFIPAGYSRTFGELPAELKHTISHRGRALRRLTGQLKESGLLGSDQR